MSVISDLEEAGVFAKDIEGWIVGSAVVHEAKMALAEKVKEYWQSIAPVWDPEKARGKVPPTIAGNMPEDYRDSIDVREEDGVITVGSDFDPLAEWIEYGNEHMPEYAPGMQTLAHFGGGPVDAAEKVTDKLFIG